MRTVACILGIVALSVAAPASANNGNGKADLGKSLASGKSSSWFGVSRDDIRGAQERGRGNGKGHGQGNGNGHGNGQGNGNGHSPGHGNGHCKGHVDDFCPVSP